MRIAAMVLLIVSLVVLLVLPPWAPERLSAGLFRNREAMPRRSTDRTPSSRTSTTSTCCSTATTRSPSIAVKEFPIWADRRRAASSATASPDGSLVLDYPTTALFALVPALLAEKAERAFVIGWGAGVSVGELRRCAR